jgi:HNH endonuclease
MAITQKSIKLLWSGAAGRCSFEGCQIRLCGTEAGGAAPYTLGEMAHICGDQPGANRYSPAQTQYERDDYANLLLLCPNHHTLIDKKENEAVYAAQILLEMKAAHEARVLTVLDSGGLKNGKEVATRILILLEENRQCWLRYGPTSDIARRESHNEAVHAVWVSERLAIIVPNNRKISEILSTKRDIFGASNQRQIAAFLQHARSYERWVQDEIPYAAVGRFPSAFDDLIRETANGRK